MKILNEQLKNATTPQEKSEIEAKLNDKYDELDRQDNNPNFNRKRWSDEVDELVEANNNVRLHVEFYPYERYGGGGGKKKANVSAPDMLTALKKLVDKMRLYIDSEEIEDEGYTPEEVIEQIQMSNGDGCDYITLLQEMNSGDILIQEDYDEEEDWDDMDESLKENKKSLKEAQSAITMQEVIKALKNLRQDGYSVNVKNKGFIVSTYERDMYFAGYLQDLLDYANAHINELDNPDDLDELTYLVDDYVNSECERAGAHHSFEIPEMKEKVKKLRQKYLGESLEEDLENLEKVDADTVMNITMGTAKEESKTLWQRLEDAEEIPEDAPLFGAKDQPVPEEVEEPKVTLDESLFKEGLSASYFGKLAAKAAEAIEDFQDAFTGLPYDFEGIIQDTEIMDLDRAVEVLYQVQGRARDLMENVSNKRLNEQVIKVTDIDWDTDGEDVDLPTDVEISIDELDIPFDELEIDLNNLKEDDAFIIEDEISEYLSDAYGWLVNDYRYEINESLKESDEDDAEISDEVINDILDDVKGVFDECEFTPDEVVDKIFDCIADESKVEFAQGILDSMEEGEEELTEGVETFEDSLAVIKKYFNGRKASEVIDTIFTNNPAVDSDKLEDVAIKLGQFLDDYLDECKLAENFI